MHLGGPASLASLLGVARDSRPTTSTLSKAIYCCVIAWSVLLLFRGLLLMGNFILDCVQIDLFPRFWEGIIKFKSYVFVGSALTLYFF